MVVFAILFGLSSFSLFFGMVLDSVAAAMSNATRGLIARIDDCRMAIVLSPDYADRSSDAVVAAAVSVIDRIKPDIYIVAECGDAKHLPLFESCHCDSVVLGMSIAGNLLVQEVHDPGIAQLIDVLTSNRRGSEGPQPHKCPPTLTSKIRQSIPLSVREYARIAPSSRPSTNPALCHPVVPAIWRVTRAPSTPGQISIHASAVLPARSIGIRATKCTTPRTRSWTVPP